MMYGQMTAGLVDLYRQPGHRAGHLRDLCRGRAAPFRRRPVRQMDPDGGARRHGRRPAAGRHHGRGLDDRHRMPAVAHRDAAQDALSRRKGRHHRRGHRDRRARPQGGPAGLRRRAGQRGGNPAPDLVERGIRPDVLTDQTSAHDPINGYLPAGWSLADWQDKRQSDPKAVEAAARASMRTHVEAMLKLHRAGRRDAGLRQQHPPGGLSTWGSRTPSSFPASCRPISGPCSAAASGRSAGRRCRAIRKTSTAPMPASRN
jgi:hypothetical protein